MLLVEVVQGVVDPDEVGPQAPALARGDLIQGGQAAQPLAKVGKFGAPLHAVFGRDVVLN